jgi:hypothetical protein
MAQFDEKGLCVSCHRPKADHERDVAWEEWDCPKPRPNHICISAVKKGTGLIGYFKNEGEVPKGWNVLNNKYDFKEVITTFGTAEKALAAMNAHWKKD